MTIDSIGLMPVLGLIVGGGRAVGVDRTGGPVAGDRLVVAAEPQAGALLDPGLGGVHREEAAQASVIDRLSGPGDVTVVTRSHVGCALSPARRRRGCCTPEAQASANPAAEGVRSTDRMTARPSWHRAERALPNERGAYSR